MVYNNDMLAIINQQVRAGQTAVTAMGTMVQRNLNTYDTQCVVIIDGSTQAIPVKIVGSVTAFDGDRVILNRVGSDWVVMASFVKRPLGSATYGGTSFSSGNTSSGSYGDLPGSPSVSVTKAYNDTDLRVHIVMSAFATNVGAQVRVGVSIPEQAVLANVGNFFYNVNNTHLTVAGIGLVPGVNAGTLTVKGQWLLSGGVGPINVDSGDWISMDVQEVA